MLCSAISSKENYVAAEFPPVMLFSSLQRTSYPLRQQAASRNENGKRGGWCTKWQGVPREWEGKLCVTAHNNASDARAVFSMGCSLSSFYYFSFEI